MATKRIYAFGGGKAEGDMSMKDLLGGKGAGVAEMSRIGLPVPPGFTITTEVCNLFQAARRSRSSPGGGSATRGTRCSYRSAPARASRCPA
jgi:phosphoenolpyruvate synthase/pyruvate phosphate dikinase